MLPVLLFLSLLTAQPPSQPATQPAVERPMDPWVFRCVLDGEPRRLVVALSDEYFLSYDLDRCILDKVWKPAEEGGVDLTGTVYDHRHGPQPVSRGEVIYEAGPDDEWTDGSDPRYLGVTVDDNTGVTLHWSVMIDGERTQVNEQPHADGAIFFRESNVDLPNDFGLATEQ